VEHKKWKVIAPQGFIKLEFKASSESILLELTKDEKELESRK